MAVKAKAPERVVATVLPPIKWDKEMTNSARSTFLACRKKFEWQYLRRLSPRAPSVPFLVGGLVHNGLERMYVEKDFDEAAERETAAAACEKVSMEASLTPDQSDKLWQQQAMVIGILRGYAKHHLEEDLKKWEVVGAETSFVHPLPVAGWKYRGKRDMVVRLKKNGKIGLVEHKTAGRLDANYIAKLPLDSQILGYAKSMELEKKPLGKLPDFIVYNVIKKSQLRQGAKETFDAFRKRIEDEYVHNPSVYFYREVLSFSERDVRRFEEERARFTVEMQRAIDDQYFYMNTQHCTAMGVCPYMRLCIEGPNKSNLVHYKVRASVHPELDEQEEIA